MVAVLTRQYANVAGLALIVYDQALTWDKEVKCIWRSSERGIKLSFFLARYLATNLVYTHPHILKRGWVGCHTWFGFQTSGIGLLLINLELTLMLRVYALYERSLKIKVILASWFIFSLGMSAFIGGRSIHVLKLDSNCIMTETPETTTTFSVMVMLDQCVLWGLTCYKYRDAIRNGWSKNPIMRLVMRDNTWTCIGICCLFIAVLPYSLVVEQIGHIMYCLLCSLLSITTCRMILNMRSLEPPSRSEGPEFTTGFDEMAMS
ncbi:hypothetical protein P691DRAFT_796652 [Macrolepiota fuliginosa MF-IS2]|uniref:DUF6533 domain-containing protein n=1 Tax=Macrolepiota fuliginosa MF-IS2 TaxID=1400762 RepID=A0A9P5X6K6_9AGAR|nr:hypothetical protein P691DRAFT_796652 [Macrolepiota fuliginosa MF-IS2]